MKSIKLFFLIVSVFGCVACQTENKKEKKIKHPLVGEWQQVNLDHSGRYPRSYVPPFGIAFSENKVEVYTAFYLGKHNRRKPFPSQFFNNYQIKNGFIYLENKEEGYFQKAWEIIDLQKEKLVLKSGEKDTIYLKKMETEATINFDQIIFSRGGCYGSCPILDISINDQGVMYYQGDKYVDKEGDFIGKVNNVLKRYVFSTFGKVHIDTLSDKYLKGPTDQEHISISFVKKGKLIKTIYDYGRSGPSILSWSYRVFKNWDEREYNDTTAMLTPDVYCVNIHQSDSLIFALEKSESFFLRTELEKAKITNTNFENKYEVWFREGITLYDIEQRDKGVTEIKTDGRYFKFNFKQKETETYDLGYNFINRNLTVLERGKK